MHLVSLNGEWKLTYRTSGSAPKAWGRWIPAQVPGDVHLDLMRAGLINEPLEGLNAERCRWIEEKQWLYRRTFVLDDVADKRLELVCEGLDLTAIIWVNGVEAGRANNMFRRYRFDVTDLLTAGVNEIIIQLDVGLEAVSGVDTDRLNRLWSMQDPRRAWMRKAGQAFSWDIAPRLMTCGIWRDIYIEILDEVILRDSYVSSSFQTSEENVVSAKVRVDVDIELLAGTRNVRVEARLKDDRADAVATATLALQAGVQQATLWLDMADAKLWWPNGMGAPHLYTVDIRLLDADDTARVFGQKTLRHGIRTIEVEQLPLNEIEKTFTLRVNGHRVFCKGGNWVAADAIYARIDRDRQYRLLKYAQQANLNMIRVWGGGIYPDDDFFTLCDDLGLMVWQDFMFACAYYPDDEPAFYQEVYSEIDDVVRRLRNYASLVLWCGNNENHMMHHRLHPQGHFYGGLIYGEIIPQLLARHDPGRYYHPSSPYPGPWPGQERSGNQHVWSYVLGWHDVYKRDICGFSDQEKATAMKIWDIPEFNHKFISEFGIFCPSNRSSIQKFMGAYPLELDGDTYNYHRNYFEADFIEEMLRRYYKKRTAYDFDEFTIAGQMVQAEALKHIFEEFRSRMYTCSGVLYWEYNDSWGHIGYSPVDYYLNVKPLYFYMRRAFAPMHIVFRENGREVWLLNDTCDYRQVTVTYGIQRFTGDMVQQYIHSVSIAPSSSLKIGTIEPEGVDAASAFVFSRLFDAQGGLIERNRAFMVPTSDVQMPPDSLISQITRLDASTWQVELSSKAFTWMVKLDADENLDCDDNAFDLWPGESKTVLVKTESENPDLEIRVQNINQFLTRQEMQP